MNPRLFRLAALVLLAVAGPVVPARAAPQVTGAAAHSGAAPTLGSDFATSLTGTISGQGHAGARTVRLDVRRSSDDTTVRLTIDIASSGGTAGSEYTFTVPASDLQIANTSISLDTHQHLGAYGHMSVQWTASRQAEQVQIPGNPCYGRPAVPVTRVVASATAQLDLTLPCEGTVRGVLGGTNLDLDSGQDVSLQHGSPSPDRSIYYTSVSATKSLGAGKGLLLSATKTSTAARITVSAGASSAAGMGLTGSSHFATDVLPLAGLAAGTNHAGQAATVLTYHGALGSAGLAFTGTGETMATSDQGRCVNPSAATSDLGKTVGEQMTRASVEGSVSLTAAAVCSALQATFGSGDEGMVAVFGPAFLAAGAAPSAMSNTLPAPGRGDIPGIQQIALAPGGALGGARTITVTFAHALPAHAYLVIMLKGPGGAVLLSDPVLHGGAATVSLGASSALQPGTYTLDVSATSSTGGQVFYEGSFTASASPSAGGTPAAPTHALPGVIVTGDFPPVVDISPKTSSTITTRTPTFVVTFKSRLAADASIRVICGPSDSQGNPTGIVQLSDPVVRGNTVTASVPSSSALSPGRYVFIIQGNDSGGMLEYRAMFMVK